jgi:hypothetical protein
LREFDLAHRHVLTAGRRAALIFGPQESLADFELQLSYEDPTARPHRLTAGWRLEHRSYIEGETPPDEPGSFMGRPSLTRLVRATGSSISSARGQFSPQLGNAVLHADVGIAENLAADLVRECRIVEVLRQLRCRTFCETPYTSAATPRPARAACRPPVRRDAPVRSTAL